MQSFFDFQAVPMHLFSLDNLSKKAKEHLTKVYSMLIISSACSVASICLQIKYEFVLNEILSLIGVVGCLVGMVFVYPHQEPGDSRTLMIRRGLFLAFSCFYGSLLTPLIGYALNLRSDVLLVSLISTVLVFISFTISALYTTRRSFLFLGGILGSMLSAMTLASLFSMFFESKVLFNFNLYVGLLVFCGYILYDTQIIVEKAEYGSTDVVGHSLELYVDFILIFVRILIILVRQEENRKKNQENENR